MTAIGAVTKRVCFFLSREICFRMAGGTRHLNPTKSLPRAGGLQPRTLEGRLTGCAALFAIIKNGVWAPSTLTRERV